MTSYGHKCVFLALNFFLLISFAYSQNGCTTPNSRPGTCIAINECKKLYDLLLDRYRSPEDTRLIRNSQCGQENRQPKVCCESEVDSKCVNPDQNPGTCMGINDCVSLRPLLALPNPLPKNILDYLRQSTCRGVEQYSICCSEKPPSVLPQNPVTPTVSVNTNSLLPKPNECGNQDNQNRIIGGVEAEIDDYPWMVLIEYRNRLGRLNLGCGGSLISTKYVLTAAHCITGQILVVLGNPINVRLGEHNKTNPGQDCIISSKGDKDCNDELVTIDVERTIAHPQFENTGGPKNDIGLIRLVRPTSYTDFIKPICLPSTDITYGLRTKSVNFVVAGWGTTEQNRGSDVKLKLQIPFVTLSECQAAYTRLGTGNTLWDKQLCAGGEKGKDSCRGDSGGPLMDLSPEKRYNLIGVVSYGPTPCAAEGVPGVYTKIFSYLDWIKGQLQP